MSFFYCLTAGYQEGYTGADHLLPDHHLGMVGKSYVSLAEAQAELDRRTVEAVPARAVIAEVRVTNERVRSAWEAKAEEMSRALRQVAADRCRRLAKTSTAFDARVDVLGRVVVGDYPPGWHVSRQELEVVLGTVEDETVCQHTLKA